MKLNKFNESEYAEIENIYKIPEDYNHTPKVTYKIYPIVNAKDDIVEIVVKAHSCYEGDFLSIEDVSDKSIEFKLLISLNEDNIENIIFSIEDYLIDYFD